MQHDNMIWGTRCVCGRSCSIMQTEHHPWCETDFEVVLDCPGCGRTHRVNCAKASDFYDEKIQAHFRDVSGAVVDLGCGGGFLSRFVLGLDSVHEVFGIDSDEGCVSGLEDLLGDEHFHFLNRDVSDLGAFFSSIAIDYVIGRDILMFVPDLEQLFADISTIATRGFRLMGWFIPDDPRVANEMHPEDMASELRSRGWPTKLEFLDWYKSGYFIAGDRRSS